MGWTFVRLTRDQLIRELTATEETERSRSEVIDHTLVGNVLWTVAYDTYYAMTDRDDDLKIGVKSTAILFGDADRVIILTLQGLSLACLLLAGARFELGGWFHLGLLAAAGCFAWEFWYTRDRDRLKCFKAFLHNHWAGLAIFVGIVADYGFR